MNSKYRIRVEDNFHGRQAIMLEIYDEEYKQYGTITAFPIENFAKNKNLAQILLNHLADLFNTDKEIKIIQKDVEN